MAGFPPKILNIIFDTAAYPNGSEFGGRKSVSWNEWTWSKETTLFWLFAWFREQQPHLEREREREIEIEKSV